MMAMRLPRTLRVILAVVFGFMSLSHGPVMAFAKAHTPASDRAANAAPTADHHDHSRHHRSTARSLADQQNDLALGANEGAAICYSAGCFVAVAPLLAVAPSSLLFLLEQLSAAPARPLAPNAPDPLVPPPRLQA
jgi:hypothetical protein